MTASHLAAVVTAVSFGFASAQWNLEGAEYINSPSRCEHYNVSQAIICGEIVTWPVQLYGTDPSDPAYETMEQKLFKEESYKNSLLPLLDREGCKTDFLLFICPALYQPCFEVDDATGTGETLWKETNFPETEEVRLPSETKHIFPRGGCGEACTALNTGECDEKLGQARGFQDIGSTVVPVPVPASDGSCPNDKYGGITPLAADTAKDFFVNYIRFPAEYEGQLIYPVESNTVNGIEVPCFNVRTFTEGVCFKADPPQCNRRGTTDNPYFMDYFECVGTSCEKDHENECVANVCPDNFLRESGENACNLACVAVCPDPIFNDDEISMMWLCFIIPALIGLPLNIYAAASFIAGVKTVHKKTPMMLKNSAMLAVLWTLVSVIPSAALFTDTVCTFDVAIAKGSNDTCYFLRGTVCILQSMLYWVLASVVDLHLAVVNGKTPSARKDFHKFYHMWCWGVPLLMYILTYALEVTDPELLFRANDFDGAYPALNWNLYKDIFSCTPKMRTIEQELVIVWSHFVLAALSIFLVLCSVLSKIGSIYKKQSHKSGKSGAAGGEQSSGCMASLAAFKSAMDKYGATKLTLLGLAAFVLVILLMVTIVDTFPQMEDFNVASGVEYSCSITEQAQYAGQPCLDVVPTTCCYDEFNPGLLGVGPNPNILGIGYFMSLSLIPMIYGCLFGIDHKHAVVWKKMFTNGKVGQTNSGSVVSSSAN